MRGLVVEPFGACNVITNPTNETIAKLVGKGHNRMLSTDASCHVYVHELWLVADLPINVFASYQTGTIIGGTTIIVPIEGTNGDEQLFSGDFETIIRTTNQNADTVARLQESFSRTRKQTNFVQHEPGRWLYNGMYFSAIVIGEADDHESNESPKYNVWFFKSISIEPFLMRLVDYSLREVMEGMILDDENTFNGNPPDHFKGVLKHFQRG